MEESWRVFIAVLSFAVLGFLISRDAGAQWGALFGVYGFFCYIVGYMLGWTFRRESR